MAYRFRLETVLSYRRNLEELAQQELGRQNMLLEEAERRLIALKERILFLFAEMERRQKEGILGAVLNLYLDGVNSLEWDTARETTRLELQKKEVERARKKMMERMKERKIIERAREKDYARFVREDFKKQQNENDEQAILRFGRDKSI